MELNEMEKRLIFQTEGYGKSDVTYELRMCLPYIPDPVRRKTAAELVRKLDAMPEKDCLALIQDIRKNYRIPAGPKTMGELLAEARQKSGAEKLKGHDIMALERFDPEVKHMIVFDVLSGNAPVGDKGDKMRLFLTDAGYQKFLDSQERGEVRLKNHATGSIYAADVDDLRTRLDSLWDGMDKLLRGFANISYRYFILCSERQMGRRGDRRPKEVMNPGCPSGKRNPRNRLWQAGRDDGADHNGTSSRLPKDLGRVPAACAALAKRRRMRGYDAATLSAACNSPALFVQGLPGGVANTAADRNQIDCQFPHYIQRADLQIWMLQIWIKYIPSFLIQFMPQNRTHPCTSA